MIDDSVSTPQITAYLRSMLPQNDAFLKELEQQALEQYIPVIQPEVAQLLRVLLQLSSAKSVLEVGTAIGYSAIIFAKSLPGDGHVTTLEIRPEMVQAASENIKAAGFQNKITVLEGDAYQSMERLNGTFDCIFLDGAKGQYLRFLPLCLSLLKEGGLFISDNILYRGSVAEDGFIPRKHRTIIRNLKEYLKVLSNHPQLTTTILPIGDGVAVCRKQRL